MVRTHRLHIGTSGQGDAHDITRVVSDAVSKTGMRAGTATVAECWGK